MKPLRSNKYAQNLEFHQVQTSASKVTITILVSVFIHVTNLGRSGTSNSYLDNNKFSYELGKAILGNLIYFIMKDKVKVKKV